jgi:hypothetical protein
MRHKISFLFFFSLLFGMEQASAQQQPLSGLALVRIQSKAIDLEAHQVVTLTDKNADFAALDEMGGVAFRLSFVGTKMLIMGPDGETAMGAGKLKTLLSLPLTKDELVRIIRHERPATFTETATGLWQNRQHKKLTVVFSEMGVAKGSSVDFPAHVLVAYKKSILDFRWISFAKTP